MSVKLTPSSRLSLTIAGLRALFTSVALFVAVAADDLLGLGTFFGAMSLLSAVVAGSTSTTLRAVTREMAN